MITASCSTPLQCCSGHDIGRNVPMPATSQPLICRRPDWSSQRRANFAVAQVGSLPCRGSRRSCAQRGYRQARRRHLQRGAATIEDEDKLRKCLAAAATAGGSPQVAMDGDVVTIHYICRDEEGNIVDDSAASEDPVSFEVGAGEVTGNPLFQAFDEAIRGLPLGSTTVLEAKGGEWQRELFFEVPRDHEEMVRLEGRYKNQGGLTEGMVVELANGASAVVLGVTEAAVQIDANNMMAGKSRTFEVKLLDIEPAQR